MGRYMKDITNQRFGDLVALKPVDKDLHLSFNWLCRCDCGAEVVINGRALRTGHTKSCGCRRKTSTYKFNCYDIIGEVTEITDVRGNTFIIDTKLLPEVSKNYWWLGKDNRLICSAKKLLPNVVSKAPKGSVVSHKNENKLDNRVRNLEVRIRNYK